MSGRVNLNLEVEDVNVVGTFVLLAQQPAILVLIWKKNTQIYNLDNQESFKLKTNPITTWRTRFKPSFSGKISFFFRKLANATSMELDLIYPHAG